MLSEIGCPFCVNQQNRKLRAHTTRRLCWASLFWASLLIRIPFCLLHVTHIQLSFNYSTIFMFYFLYRMKFSFVCCSTQLLCWLFNEILLIAPCYAEWCHLFSMQLFVCTLKDFKFFRINVQIHHTVIDSLCVCGISGTVTCCVSFSYIFVRHTLTRLVLWMAMYNVHCTCMNMCLMCLCVRTMM